MDHSRSILSVTSDSRKGPTAACALLVGVCICIVLCVCLRYDIHVYIYANLFFALKGLAVQGSGAKVCSVVVLDWSGRLA